MIVSVTPYHAAARCPIDNYCLNSGSCAYYKSIGELVCRYLPLKTHLLQKKTPNRAICRCLQVAAAQTNFMASYIHLDAHCPASLDELEAQDIRYTQSVTSSG